MKKVCRSYLALKHDVVTMRLPFPFLQDFSITHKTHGAAKIHWVFYEDAMASVAFENHVPSCFIDVDDLFDLSGAWDVDFGKLARRATAFKASYERRRNELINSSLDQLKREERWYQWYGRASTSLVKKEVKSKYRSEPLLVDS